MSRIWLPSLLPASRWLEILVAQRHDALQHHRQHDQRRGIVLRDDSLAHPGSLPFISDLARGCKSSGVCRETVGAVVDDSRGVEQPTGVRRQCPDTGLSLSDGAACEAIA